MTMSEKIQLSADFGTTFSQIQKLRREMILFVESNSRDYASELEVEIVDAKGLDKLLLQIVIKHKSNWQNDALRAHRRNKVNLILVHCSLQFMCALVQAVRKVGIIGGGPGIGAAVNPMHIVRTSGVPNIQSPPDRPLSTDDDDMTFGQKRSIVEDPTTQVDDDDRQPPLRFEYYNEEILESQSPGTTGLRSDEEALRQEGDIDRGRSFGRRRKQVPGDLEKGQQH